MTTDLHDRIVSLVRYAEGLSPAGILFTCSAFGGAIEAVARSAAIPVLKPNEALFEQAFSSYPSMGQALYSILKTTPDMILLPIFCSFLAVSLAY